MNAGSWPKAVPLKADGSNLYNPDTAVLQTPAFEITGPGWKSGKFSTCNAIFTNSFSREDTT
jgi:hypothetical protein